jgi:hypothetical protein
MPRLPAATSRLAIAFGAGWRCASLRLGLRWIARRGTRRRARILPQPRFERRDPRFVRDYQRLKGLQVRNHRWRQTLQHVFGRSRQHAHAASLQNRPSPDYPARVA